MKKNINRFFIMLSIIALFFVIKIFYTWNRPEIVQLPDTNGTLTYWGVDSCDIKKNYVYVSAWSSPMGVTKFDNTIYVKSADGNGYIKLKGQVYRRYNETEYMKQRKMFDNSGIISAIRITPWELPTGKDIVMISRNSDGKLYRGDYACK